MKKLLIALLLISSRLEAQVIVENVAASISTTPTFTTVSSTSFCFVPSRGCITASADGVFNLLDNAGTSFGRLTFGGTTSAFPAIKRNGTAINFRLADDSADSPITASVGTFSTSTSSPIYAATSDITFAPANVNKIIIAAGGGAGAGTVYPIGDNAQDNGTTTERWRVLNTVRMNGIHFTVGTITAVSNTSANSCGTTAAVISTGSNDNSGSFTVGATAGTSCTLTFNIAATNRRDCMANNETTANLARVVYLTTTTSKVEGTFNGADIVSYVCFAR